MEFENNPKNTIIAYDNSTKALYSASNDEISIFRVLDNNNIRYRFLDYLAVRFMSVMPKKSLLFLASSYSIVTYRLTSTYEKT